MPHYRILLKKQKLKTFFMTVSQKIEFLQVEDKIFINVILNLQEKQINSIKMILLIMELLRLNNVQVTRHILCCNKVQVARLMMAKLNDNKLYRDLPQTMYRSHFNRHHMLINPTLMWIRDQIRYGFN